MKVASLEGTKVSPAFLKRYGINTSVPTTVTSPVRRPTTMGQGTKKLTVPTWEIGIPLTLVAQNLGVDKTKARDILTSTKYLYQKNSAGQWGLVNTSGIETNILDFMRQTGTLKSFQDLYAPEGFQFEVQDLDEQGKPYKDPIAKLTKRATRYLRPGETTTENPFQQVLNYIAFEPVIGDFSISDLTGLAMIGVEGFQGIQSAWNSLLRRGLTNGLSSEITLATGKKPLPSEVNQLTNSLLEGIPYKGQAPSRLRVANFALRNLFTKTPTGMYEATSEGQQAANKTVTALIQQIRPQITKFTQFGGGMPGMTTTTAGIQASLVNKLGAPAEVIKNIGERQPAYLKLQEVGKNNGFDIEAVKGLKEGEYWVALSGFSGGGEKYLNWVKKFPQEIQDKILKVLTDKVYAQQRGGGLVPAKAEVIGGGGGGTRFIFFRNLNDVQKFLDTGDTSLIQTSLTQKAPSMTLSERGIAQKYNQQLLNRETRVNNIPEVKALKEKVDKLQAQYDKLVEENAPVSVQAPLRNELRTAEYAYKQLYAKELTALEEKEAQLAVAGGQTKRVITTRGISEAESNKRIADLQARIKSGELEGIEIGTRGNLIPEPTPVVTPKQVTSTAQQDKLGQSIATQLGIAYDGIQEGIGMQFTDPVTKSTTYVNTLEEVRTNINKMRVKAGVAEILTGTPQTIKGETVTKYPIDATWRTPEGDRPVKITAYAGTMNGVKYYNIEGSKAAIPETDIILPPQENITQTTAKSTLKKPDITPKRAIKKPVEKEEIIGGSGLERIKEMLVIGELTKKIQTFIERGFNVENQKGGWVEQLIKGGANPKWAKATVDSITKELIAQSKPVQEVPESTTAPPKTPVPPSEPPQPPANNLTPSSKPMPSMKAMDNVKKYAKEFVSQDQPGVITKILDQIPGIKQALEFERPGLQMLSPEKKHILEAHIAGNLGRIDVVSRGNFTNLPIMRDIIRTFGNKAIMGKPFKIKFLGTPEQAKCPFTYTLKDVMENPDLYELTDAQKKIISNVEKRNTDLLNYLKDGYGAEVGQFKVKEGAAFLSNVDISENAIEVHGTELKAITSGRMKERYYPTARNRWEHDKNFKPELNLVKLLSGMDRAKGNSASNLAFKEVLGGLKRDEVLKETHTDLYNKWTALKKRLISLQGTAGRLDARLHENINNFLNSNLEGEDFGNLQSDLDVKLKSGKNKGKGQTEIQKEMDGVRAQIKALRPSWETANPKPYTLVKEGIFRYFPADQSKIIRSLLKKGGNVFLGALMNIKATAFSGDFSPITWAQMPLGLASDPIGAFAQVAKSIKNGSFFKAFSVEEMARKDSLNPDEAAEFYYLMGHTPTGMPQEFSGGYLSKIPGFTKANEGMFNLVLHFQRGFYDRTWKGLVKSGMPAYQAKVAAATITQRAFMTSVSTQRLGQSGARAELLNSLPTSYTFLRTPFMTMNDAAKGFFKGATFQNPTAVEKNSLKILLNIFGTMMVLCVSAAALDAYRNNRDPKQAVLDAINPSSSGFMSIVVNGFRIPIGGPYRAFVKAMWPDTVQGVDYPIPFANLFAYFYNRINPAERMVFDLIQNKDYFGAEIYNGNLPTRIYQVLEYALEGSLPLTLGTALEGVRQGLTQEEILVQALGQLSGLNIIEDKWKEVNALRDQYAETEYGKKYSELPDKYKEELSLKYKDLKTMEEEAKTSFLLRGAQLDKVFNDIETLAEVEFNAKMAQLAQSLLSGDITKSEYDDQRTYFRNYYAGQKNAQWALRMGLDPDNAAEIERLSNQKANPLDKALDDYWEFYSNTISNSPLPKNWDTINQDISNYVSQLSPEAQEYIKKYKDSWISQLPEAAQQVELMRKSGIEDESWWENYDNNRSVNKALMEINRYVSMIGQQDIQGMNEALSQAKSEAEKTKVKSQGWTVDMNKIGSVIYNMTVGIEPSKITKENGFPDLVIEYWKAKKLIEKYNLLPSDTKQRQQYRLSNPDVDAALIIWGGYGSIYSTQARNNLQNFLRVYNIPTQFYTKLLTSDINRIGTTATSTGKPSTTYKPTTKPKLHKPSLTYSFKRK